MTVKEAIKHLEYSKKAYQNLIDNDVRKVEAVGENLRMEFESASILEDCYKVSRDSLEMGIQALKKLEMQDKELENLKKEIADNAWDYEDAAKNKKCVFLDDVMMIIDSHTNKCKQQAEGGKHEEIYNQPRSN